MSLHDEILQKLFRGFFAKHAAVFIHFLGWSGALWDVFTERQREAARKTPKAVVDQQPRMVKGVLMSRSRSVSSVSTFIS